MVSSNRVSSASEDRTIDISALISGEPDRSPKPKRGSGMRLTAAASALDGRGVQATVNTLLVLMGLGALLCALIVLGLRINDRYLIDHVAGAWMALAQAAREGIFYPAFYDGEFFGGTRNMPVPIVLHAGLAEITGDYLVGGKLLSGLSCFAIAITVFIAASMSGLAMPYRLALAGLFLITGSGTLVFSGIRNDALPVALQLAAILIVERKQTMPALLGAGLLCAVAMLSKLTALWGPAAIGLYLLVTNWRLLVVFVPAVLVPVAIGIAGFNAISDGRMLDNLLGVSLANENTIREYVGHMRRFVDDLTNSARVAGMILIPLGLVEMVRATAERRLLPRHYALVFSLLLTMVAYTDRGVFSNHLIDLIVLLSVVAAELLRRSTPAQSAVIAILLLWVSAVSVLLDRSIVLAAARAAVGQEFPRNPFTEFVAEDQTLLSQDPYVPVIMGQRPVVMDAFMFQRLATADPSFDDPLVADIEAKTFDRIVLLLEIETAPEDRLMRQVHFGEPVWQAIIANYEKIGEIEPRYNIYAPKSGP